MTSKAMLPSLQSMSVAWEPILIIKKWRWIFIPHFAWNHRHYTPLCLCQSYCKRIPLCISWLRPWKFMFSCKTFVVSQVDISRMLVFSCGQIKPRREGLVYCPTYFCLLCCFYSSCKCLLWVVAGHFLLWQPNFFPTVKKHMHYFEWFVIKNSY